MKQTEKNYLISDAAKQVQVESHVLRYWEEELKLPIKRNELGHRYYTKEDIERFCEIRDLKERGLQLKAIRTLLTGRAEESGTEDTKREMVRAATRLTEDKQQRHVVMVNRGEFVPVTEESKEAKSIRLQQLLQNMIAEAVRCNNREVCDEIKETVLKELDYQFRLQEEKEDERELMRVSRQEEHFRQIDELLRARHKKRGFGAKNDVQEADGNKTDEEQKKNIEDKESKKHRKFLMKKRSIN